MSRKEGPDTDKVIARCETGTLRSAVIAKFHYTDTDTGPTRTRTRTRTRTDPHGPDGVSPQKSPCPCPCRARVHVRVVEFSYYGTTSARSNRSVGLVDQKSLVS